MLGLHLPDGRPELSRALPQRTRLLLLLRRSAELLPHLPVPWWLVQVLRPPAPAPAQEPRCLALETLGTVLPARGLTMESSPPPSPPLVDASPPPLAWGPGLGLVFMGLFLGLGLGLGLDLLGNLGLVLLGLFLFLGLGLLGLGLNLA